MVVDLHAGTFTQWFGPGSAIQQTMQRHGYTFFQGLTPFYLRQMQQALDQLLKARFRLDISHKALTLGLRHFTLLKARRRHEWLPTKQLMGQGMHIALNIGLAFQLTAHLLQRRSQLAQLHRRAEPEHRSPTATARA